MKQRIQMLSSSIRGMGPVLGLVMGLVLGTALPGLCGCSGCMGIQGLSVNERDGTVWVTPVTGGVNLGPGAPSMANANNLPGSGTIRNWGSATEPDIRLGMSRISTNTSGNVLVDGVARPLWVWNANTSTLTTPDGRAYTFNTAGLLTGQTGPGGQRAVTIQYDATYPDRITTVTDSYGSTWTYGVGSAKAGPSYITGPDGTTKVTFDYVPFGGDGAGQYSEIVVYNLSGATWVEQERTDYTYEYNKVVSVSTTYAGDPSHPSTTNLTYWGTDQGGRTLPLQRLENSKLRIDLRYDYTTESIAWESNAQQSSTYGVTTVRRRADYGSDGDSQDQVTKFCFYQDSSGKNGYLFRAIPMIYSSGALAPYSTTEYRLYGYLERFTGAPTEQASLQGQVWTVVDGRGYAKTYAYSTDNAMVTQVTLPSGDYVQYAYLQLFGKDSAFVDQIRDARGKWTKYDRDSTNPALVTDVKVGDNSSSYGNPIVQYAYYTTADEGPPYPRLGMLKSETVPGVEDGTANMVTQYDYQETVGTTIYYRPSPTKEAYSYWNGASYADADVQTSYYADGRVNWAQDAFGNKTYLGYDAEKRLVQTIYPQNSEGSGTIQPNLWAARTITDNSKTWVTNQFAGMLLQISGVGFFTVASNDGHTVTITADSNDISGADNKTYWLKPITKTVYSQCCGLPTWRTDPDGHKTFYQYDDGSYGGPGRLTSIRNDVTTSTSDYPLIHYTYNDLGQILQATTYKDNADSTGRTTTYTYDQLGRLTHVAYPTDGATQLLYDEYYQYDHNGNTVARLKGNLDSSNNVDAGQVVAYEYDTLDRLTKTKYDYYSGGTGTGYPWPIPTITVSNPDVTYQYDGGSLLKTQMTDASGTSSYSYDTQGRLETYSPPLPADYSVSYTYNNADEKTVVTVTDGTQGYRSAYRYFANGWLKQVKGQQLVSGTYQDITEADFTYDAAGTRKTRSNGLNGGGVQSSFIANARNETQCITHKDSAGAVLYAMTYTRDGNGNPLAIAFSGAQYPFGTRTATYQYDAMDRLIQEVQSGTTTWAYDWADNRLDSGAIYNAADELTTANSYNMWGGVTDVPSSSASPYTHYVRRGDNLITQIQVVSGGTPVTHTTMTWDASDNRLQIANPSTGESWTDVYDPAATNPAVLLEAHGGGTAGGLHTYYVREPDGELLDSFDDAVSQNVYYYHLDAHGSVVLISNSAGSTVAAHAFDAWGNRLNSPAADIRPYQYTGQLGYYTHSPSQGTEVAAWVELGLRFYDSGTGAFESRDPHPVAMGTYAIRMNPMRYVDPFGEKPECTALGPPRLTGKHHTKDQHWTEEYWESVAWRYTTSEGPNLPVPCGCECRWITVPYYVTATYTYDVQEQKFTCKEKAGNCWRRWSEVRETDIPRGMSGLRRRRGSDPLYDHSNWSRESDNVQFTCGQLKLDDEGYSCACPLP